MAIVYGNGRPPSKESAHSACRSSMIASSKEAYRKADAASSEKYTKRGLLKRGDVSRIYRGDVLAVEAIVNSIHRRSLKEETAYECHSRLAKTP